jgi:molybdopterin molybdotransferase/putative molybdopterin biosynthesis protein
MPNVSAAAKPGKTPTRAEVIGMILRRWQFTAGAKTLPLSEALGRVLASEYRALCNQPVLRASGMDGVAVNSTRFAQGMPDTSNWRLGTDYVRADTGDDFDDAFDAVIPVERVEFLDGGGLRIDTMPDPQMAKSGADAPPYLVTAGLNVRPCGVSVTTGEALGQPGDRLKAADLAALAAGGIATVEVRTRPKVAFIPTGSELVSLGNAPARGQTIDSNSVLVAQTLAGMGAEPLLLPIVRDNRAELASALEQALSEAQIVLINAGSSKGAEDYNAQLLAEKGELLCHWIASAPGRPLAAAIINGKPVLDIPGPPWATSFVLDWCVGTLVAHALGTTPLPKTMVTATLTEDMGAPPHMEIMHRMNLSLDSNGEYQTAPLSRGKATVPQLLKAKAQFVNPLGHGGYKRGDKIEVELLRPLV